jgi:threonine dehydrogenase-like Zn-dependent dehydrogenase
MLRHRCNVKKRGNMQGAVLRRGEMRVEEVPDPVPSEGQVLVRIRACGICGSDLHFADHGADVVAGHRLMEGLPPTETSRVDLNVGVFMGHEFCGEVVDKGPDTKAPPVGTLVTSVPILKATNGYVPIGYSNTVNGGYGEFLVLTSRFVLPVSNGLPASHAAFTEPLAVGLHAVNRAGIAPGTGALVMGAGPIGQAVLAVLAARHIEPIVAVDLSPARRDLALRMGAHGAIDPTCEPSFEAWRRIGGGGPVVAFEAVGRPGVLNEIMRTAPIRTTIIVVGVCSGPDSFVPRFGISKELDIRFAYTYDRSEFAESLGLIVDGKVDVAHLITGESSLEAIGQSFADLKNPEQHCKIMVVP